MGLDQYAHAGDTMTPIAQWRKHNRLQGWMEKLAVEKGVVRHPSQFNCIDLELDAEDLERLEKDIINFQLPQTDGFFYGVDSYDECKSGWLHDEDMKFLVKAREALENGFKVVYSCWW